MLESSVAVYNDLGTSMMIVQLGGLKKSVYEMETLSYALAYIIYAPTHNSTSFLPLSLERFVVHFMTR